MSQTARQLVERLAGAHERGEVFLSTVSGIVTTTCDMLQWADKELTAIAVLTTKSFQTRPNPGNREPILTEPSPGCYGNSVGLRNPGMTEALEGLKALAARQPLRAVLNVSVSGSSPEEFIELGRCFAETADILELNFSCPHAAAGYGSSIGSSWEIASSYMERIRSELGDDYAPAIIPKLTPNTDELGRIARSLMDSGADGLAAINTVGPELYLEPCSGKPILLNSLGGRGGKSGRWIRRRALDAVAEIRKAVGDEPLILGMGGVSSGIDAADMIRSGADVVGIGSAFGKVPQQQWGGYTQLIRREAEKILLTGSSVGTSGRMLSQNSDMDFQPFTVASAAQLSGGVKEITLEGSLDYEAGQFVFLWLPEIGEKPFSPASSDPLTFVIKDRGPVTRALCSLSAGDTLYVRGPYGEAAPICREKRAVLVAGGTGIAVLPALAARLSRAGISCVIYYGTSDDSAVTAPMQTLLEQYGPVTVVPDQGIPGRVIPLVAEELDGSSALYTVGPEVFMRELASQAKAKGTDAASVFLSLEQTCLCGVGICGACSCSGRLTCQHGTVLPLDVIES